MVTKLSSSIQVTGAEGFQSWTSGNATGTGKCNGESCLCIAVTCVTSVSIVEALWIHAEGDPLRKQASIFL